MHFKCLFIRERKRCKIDSCLEVSDMHFTRHTDYALRLLLHLAAEPEAKGVIADVAEIHAISRNHLMKVVQQLARGGFIATQRGHGGGIALARAPERIHIGEVVRFTEPGTALADCTSCRIGPACGLSRICYEAQGAMLAVLDRYTLADSAGDRAKLAAMIDGLRGAPAPA